MEKTFERLGSTRIEQISSDTATAQSTVKITGNDYVVVLINHTNAVLTKHRVRVGQGAWTGWFLAPTIGRTCALSTVPECVNAKAWQAVFTIGCGGPAFDVEIRNEAGEGATWTGLVANCAAAGGILVLEP